MKDFWKKPKHIVLTAVAVVALILLIFGTIVVLDVTGAVGSEENVLITINEGDTLSDVADTLAREGIINDPLYFKLYIKLFASDFIVQYGFCELNSSMSYGEVISRLADVSTHALGITATIPEGYNIFDIADLMEKLDVCTAEEFLTECKTGDFSQFSFIQQASKSENRYTVVEGYLFPDTYQFPSDSTAHSVIVTMLENFEKKYTSELEQKAQSMGMTTDEVIILASVIQCEVGGITQEEATVSSVFHNRLSSDYRYLESDPTVFYANELKERDSSVTEEMQEEYSTYLSEGLPVGAISNPGLSAIEAALSPADTNYYFFVTDPNSVFYYAETYEEHLKNVAYTKTVEKNQ